MVAYDKLGVAWHPYIMYFQSPNFISEVVNTDSFGFRMTPYLETAVSPRQTSDVSGCSLVVGASTAFGVGAVSDAGTISAHLTRMTESPWLNMGGRAFSAFQEYALTANFISTIPKVETIVLVSGFNNLYLAQRAMPFDPPLGSFFHQREFVHAMQHQSRGRRARLLGLVRGLPRAITSDQRTIEQSIQLAVDSTRQSLMLWGAMSQAIGARLLFALQPTSMWAERQPMSKESELFTLLSEIDPHLTSTLQRLDQSCYMQYRNQLQRAAESLGIDFLDLNEDMRESQHNSDWHYVDRVHYTSLGYEVIAKAVERVL